MVSNNEKNRFLWKTKEDIRSKNKFKILYQLNNKKANKEFILVRLNPKTMHSSWQPPSFQ